ncbi:MAG: hydantoinase B/oxoprolinase family protein [Alphaproteobacteria bacterium]|nr:hydantoinase B/oxoprolinase family protein [Alphaproteobacteria bacterium]
MAQQRSASLMTGSGVDPVTLEIIRGGLRAVQSEMEVLIERTAMSPFIREKKDYASALYAADGRMIAGKALPFASDLVTPIFDDYPPETMKRGDIYWYNDCYLSRGGVTHTPDQVLIQPVFGDDGLIGFSQTWAHFADIGGMRPGSLSADCTEIFQEGTMVPPVRLARDGTVNEDLLKIFIRNCRFPTLVRGDLRAMLAAVALGEKRLEELAGRFGSTILRAAFDELLARTEAAVRDRLQALVPPGIYTFAESVDTDGHGSGPVTIRYKLEATEDGRFLLDQTGTDDQTKGPINLVLNPKAPGVLVGVYLLGGSTEVSLNAGAESLFDEVKLREGSVLAPRFPAALGHRGVTMLRNLSGYLGLINQASGGKAAASHSPYVIWLIRGTSMTGERFLMSDGVACGYGARPFADGHDAVYLVAQENYPAEFVDISYPMRVRTYAINPDTGGPGRWRGGCGVIRELEVLAKEAVLSVRLDAIAHPPWGTAGGKAAGTGRCVVNPGRPDERVLKPLSDGNVLKRGDIIRLETGGGGGWGHPFDREVERVLADVRGGFVSRDSAERDYGVILDAAGRTIDQAATDKRRADRPEAKLFHRHGYVETLV